MSFAPDETNPYATFGNIAAQADTETRAGFIVQTYLHLGGAILAFMAIEAVLLNLPGIENLVGLMIGNQISWLIVLGAFIGVSYLAETWARSATSLGKQYAGLSLYVVAEAVIFVPILYIANRFYEGAIPTAAVLTLVTFGGLTAVVFITRKNFSFLGPALGLAVMAAFGLIICAMLFGFQLGMLFVVAMIVIACGYILYDTSNVLHEYRIGQHVAAALALFASVALLFWYILRLVMSSRR